jgi:hypothetical protein
MLRAMLVPTRGYPRGRGEDGRPMTLHVVSLGLPPRARGRRLRQAPRSPAERATPAGAGKTPAVRRPGSARAGYPRGRGEDDTGGGRVGHLAGLPPRARGRPTQTEVRRLTPRATPAGAGKTATTSGWTMVPRGYPRGRGDDCSSIRHRLSSRGLPPRARGRQCAPAGAGTTGRSATRRRPPRGYPRGRGDDRLCGAQPVGDEGLPPRARGRPALGRVSVLARRATPAGAGTTSGVTSRRPCM